MRSITVFACESQPIVVEGLERVLNSQPDLVFAGFRATLAEGLAAAESLSPDIVLVDQAAGLKASVHFISDLKAAAPQSRAVLWANELAEVECFRVLQAGACGVLIKSMPIGALLECLRSVATGAVWVEQAQGHGTVRNTRRNGPRLTPREREIVRFICRGMRNKEIADSLAITPGTVKVHLMHIFEKTGVKDRFELAMFARKLAGSLEEDVRTEPAPLIETPLPAID